MQNSINTKKYLRAFDIITRLGQKSDDKFEFENVQAWSDFDGYNCFMAFNGVTIAIMFHGHYNIDFADSEQLEKFDKKILSIADNF